MQGNQEKKLMKQNPDRWPPGLAKEIGDFVRKWKNGEVKLCSIRALRQFFREKKKDKSKWVIAKELKRTNTEAAAISRMQELHRARNSGASSPTESTTASAAVKPAAVHDVAEGGSAAAPSAADGKPFDSS